ncbi:MAG TPA: hypothetical protein VII23_06135, partial [Terriglobales bacterium]
MRNAPLSRTLYIAFEAAMRILPVAGNDRLLPESAFNDPMLARHEVHHRARRRPLHFSRRRCCGSRTPIWVVLG